MNDAPLKKDQERSFTILEVMVAIGIMMSVVMEVVGAQGNVVAFSSYSRQVTQATWLGKQIMSQVEYYQQTQEFKELDISLKEQKFDIEGLHQNESEFTYSLNIEEWKLPILELISNRGLKKKSDDDNDNNNAPDDPLANPDPALMASMDEGMINQIFDGHIFKMAKVEVFWPEGARRNSVSLSYIMTNQKSLDQYIASQKPIFQKLLKSIKDKYDPPKK